MYVLEFPVGSSPSPFPCGGNFPVPIPVNTNRESFSPSPFLLGEFVLWGPRPVKKRQSTPKEKENYSIKSYI
jgi:hypothetical protein